MAARSVSGSPSTKLVEFGAPASAGDAHMLSTWTPAVSAVATAAEDGDRSFTSWTKVEMPTLDA